MLGVAPANIRVIDLLIMPGVTPPAVGRLHQVMVLRSVAIKEPG